MLDREDFLNAVAGQMEDVLRLAKLTTVDDAANMGGIVDRSLRALGFAQSELATAEIATGDEEKALAYADYFALRRAVLATVTKMNVSAGAAKANLREQYLNLKEQMEMALVIAQGYGLTIVLSGSGVWPVPYVGGVSIDDYESVSHDTDYISPMFAITDLAPNYGYESDY